LVCGKLVIVPLKNTPSKISFTLNAWTLSNQLPFLGITSHWIEENWELNETLIDFVELSGAHTGENLSEAFVKSCKDLGILTKVSNGR